MIIEWYCLICKLLDYDMLLYIIFLWNELMIIGWVVDYEIRR